MKTKYKEMSDEAIRMLRDAMEAYNNGDVDLAMEVKERDIAVNRMNRELFRGILTSAALNPWSQELALDFHVAVRYMERVADRSTNVAENVYYLVTGFRYSENGKK